MHTPPPPLTLGEDPRQFVFFFFWWILVILPGHTTHGRLVTFVFLPGLVRLWKDTPLFPWLEMVWHAWPRRTARARVLGHFLVSFSCLMDAWLRL